MTVSGPLGAPVTASSVSVLTRGDLDARPTTTRGDALRLVPRFTVARNGGPGTVTSAFPRGGESDFTLVLVDGARMNTFGGGLDLSQVPIADAGRIDVVRGPQSALYGSDAIGGVIQILTPPGGTVMATAFAEAARRNARNGAASVHGGAGGRHGAASVPHQREDGFTGLGADYEDVLRYPALSRTFYAGFRVAARR